MHGELHSDSISPLRQQDSETDAHEDLDTALGPEHSLLNGNRPVAHPERATRDYKMTPMGRLRAYWLGIVVCIGGFLCKVSSKQQLNLETH
jgi:hypothetical protein